LHPLLICDYGVEKYAQLVEIGECSMQQVLSNYVGCKLEYIQRYIHAFLSECQSLSKPARFVFHNPPKEAFYKPETILEIEKNKKTTTIKSDLMLYVTPLRSEDLGWNPPSAAVRII